MSQVKMLEDRAQNVIKKSKRLAWATFRCVCGRTERVKKTSSFLFLVVRPGATSSVLAPSSDALCY